VILQDRSRQIDVRRRSHTLGYKYPKADDITTEQAAYIAEYIQQFEAVLRNHSAAYADYIDIDSWVDYLLLAELTNNVDGYRLSSYLHKDKYSKLKAGPIWDLNLGYGNANYCGGESTTGWAYWGDTTNVVWCDTAAIPFWWSELMKERGFLDRVRARWTVLRTSIITRENIFALIDGYVTTIGQQAVAGNFAVWPILGRYVWPNPTGFEVDNTHDKAIESLKTWISGRIAWIDNMFKYMRPSWTARTPDPTSAPDSNEVASPEPTLAPSSDSNESASSDPTLAPSSDSNEKSSPDPTLAPSSDSNEVASPDPTLAPSASNQVAIASWNICGENNCVINSDWDGGSEVSVGFPSVFLFSSPLSMVLAALWVFELYASG